MTKSPWATSCFSLAATLALAGEAPPQATAVPDRESAPLWRGQRRST
jgi:hypothetical protein